MANYAVMICVRNKQPVCQDDTEETEVSQQRVQVRSNFDDKPPRSIN
jgi:hypothetical protein